MDSLRQHGRNGSSGPLDLFKYEELSKYKKLIKRAKDSQYSNNFHSVDNWVIELTFARVLTL